MTKRKAPSRTRIAEHLGIEPTDAERAIGYTRPYQLIEVRKPTDDGWTVITARGGKHHIKDSELEPDPKPDRKPDRKPDQAAGDAATGQ